MKTFNVIIINLTIILLVVFLIVFSNSLKDILSKTTTLKIEYINKQQTPTVDINEKITIINNELKRIDELNNKRFEMLGWGLGIIITTFTLFIAVNYVNSKTTIRDIVNDEITAKNKEFREQYDVLIKEIKDKKIELKDEIISLKKIAKQ